MKFICIVCSNESPCYLKVEYTDEVPKHCPFNSERYRASWNSVSEDRSVFGFHVEDVINYGKGEMDYIVSKKEAEEILDLLENKGDLSIGISWETLEYFIDKYFKDE